eukprot:gene11636-11781_t
MSTKCGERPATVIGFVLYEGFEPLDVVGPLNIFGVIPEIKILWIAETHTVTSSTGHMKLNAEASLQDARPGGVHKLDWLIVPGGIGWAQQQHNTTLLSFLKEWNQPDSGLQLCLSVCTGSGLLAAAGLLDGCRATSNKSIFDTIASAYPAVNWIRHARWVEDGQIVTSSGVSAGTDMAVYVVKKMLGVAKAKASLKYNEYIANTDQHNDPYADPHYDPPV